jgi:hypothetical protein
MGNIRRRLEALEKVSSARRDAGQAIANNALVALGSEEVELLISAWGAERAGRELTERESAARQAYTQALRREDQWTRLVPATRSEHCSYIRHAILITVARRCSLEKLELVRSAWCATQQGDQPTEQESAAVQMYVSEMERLCHLAGFESTEAFQALGSGATGSDR